MSHSLRRASPLPPTLPERRPEPISSVRTADGPADPSALTLLWTPQPGELRGRPGYHLGRRIGAGGFAEVFEAELHRPPLPPQRVALKRLLPGLRSDPTRQRQLRREAQIATRLTHDNIVKVFELLELGDELAIAMELVDGMQASRLLHHLEKRGCGLRLPTVAYLLQGLFSALDYLQTGAPQVDAASGLPLGHRRPLCHADISLENLMLTTAGGVKLIDFGLAGEDRSLPRPTGEDHSLTALHQVAGKPTYAPPAADGQRLRAPTVQSDLYAAGVCAWELLTGQRFPVLPPGAAARELGSLIAFAAEGLPAAGWQLLQLCLSADQTAHRCTAAQALALIRRLRADTVSPKALGALVQQLSGAEPSSAEPVAARASPLTAPTAYTDGLLQRLHGAFCAHRVVSLLPLDEPPRRATALPPRESLPGESPRVVVQAHRGAQGQPPAPAVLSQALRQGQASDAAGGLYYRVQPPTEGASPCIIGIEPGPGHIYDPLAQALLKNLLVPFPL